MSKHANLTQSQSHFANAVHANVRRSILPRNSSKKTTFNCGDLVPVYVDEVLPSDTKEMDMAFISRLTTPIFPTMDNLEIDFYAFFTPYRLVFDGWEELNGENKTGAWVPSTPAPLVPVFQSGTIPSRSIGDYMEIPPTFNMAQEGNHINAMPFRAIALIWNEWFRNQNFQAPIPLDIGPTQDENAIYGPTQPLLKVNKKFDYFSSCLPGPQKGESALIPIELNELIPVIANNLRVPIENASSLRFDSTTGAQIPVNGGVGLNVFGSYGTAIPAQGLSLDYTQGLTPSNLWADGTGVNLSASTISELRTAFQIQKLYERDARGGTRYVEMLKAHFGVEAEDYRLQRPEFLGHIHSNVGIQQVAQTSATGIQGSESPQGNLSAFSYTAKGMTPMFRKSFAEHGVLLIFAVARHKKTYQQGLPRMYSRRERLDYPLPVLAHISEQPVYTKEIYALGTPEENNSVWGYNEAWSDFRFKPNSVTGQFRSVALNSLDPWHYGDYYDSRPFLSAEWITDNSRTNVDRTLAVLSPLHDQIIMDIAFRCRETRPLPVHSVPGFVDHF